MTQVRPRGLAHVAMQRAWPCIAWRNGPFSGGVPTRAQMGRFRLKTPEPNHAGTPLIGTWNVAHSALTLLGTLVDQLTLSASR